MRVVIDSRALTAEIGSGVGWYTKQLIEALIKYTDLEVWAWYNAFRKSAVDKILPSFDLPKQPIKITRWPNQLLRVVWASFLPEVLPIELILSGIKLPRPWQKHTAQIFHAPSPIYGLPPAQKVKRVVTIHDLTFLTHPETHSENDLGMKATICKTVQVADAVIAVSKNTGQDLIELLNVPESKIHVVYEAPRAIFRKLGSRKQKAENRLAKLGVARPYFLYAGNLEPRKNLVRLIRAFEQSQLSNYQLVLTGAAAWKSDKIIKAVKNSPVRHQIILTGYVDDNVLLDLYNNAQALFYVPLYEGFGLPVLEAMACGCFVVTSKTSSLPEVGGNVAEYVNPESVDEIARKMLEVAGWSQATRNMKQKAGLEWVKNFSWQKVAQETKKVYQSLFL